MYDLFLDVVHAHINMCIPVKAIRIGKHDSDYITPYVKALLTKRNRLRKHGKVADADKLAGIINIIISNNMHNRLRKLVDAPIKQVWSMLKPDNSERNGTSRTRHLLANADKVNEYYANISTDPNYNEQHLASLRPNRSALRADFQPLLAYEVEAMLSKVTKTSPGCDCIPHWVFKRCSFELAEVVAHLYNSSLRLGVLPRQWLTAVITPVPKISNPTVLSDFRPISVTPILSRVVEKCVVTRWLRPAIPPDLIADQFAFRPTGSTSCALVYLMHHVTSMLEQNAYVRCLLVDFSKAFDRVDHVILVKKLSTLHLPPYILNWLISFLTGRSHTTRCYGIESGPLTINLSIVQGSGLGPTLYITFESDLKPISNINVIMKYADDTNLLVPEHTDVPMKDEFEAVMQWASSNKMVINLAKTKEIVFRRPSPKLDILPALPDIELVDEAKLLGIVVTNNLHFDNHINFILKTCNQRSYLVRKFRDQGLSTEQLTMAFEALILSRLMYASQSWAGFLTQDLVGRIDAFLRRMYSYGLCQKHYSFKELSCLRDLALFNSVTKSHNCIHHLLPATKKNTESLRLRGHSFLLPKCVHNLFKNSFLIRCLYNFI